MHIFFQVESAAAIHIHLASIAMKLPVMFEFLIVVIVACIMISAFATLWTASMRTIWHGLITPVLVSCRRILMTHVELYSYPSLYRFRGPNYRWFDLIYHPYFHASLELSLLERYLLTTCKTTGLILVCLISQPALWRGLIRILHAVRIRCG